MANRKNVPAAGEADAAASIDAQPSEAPAATEEQATAEASANDEGQIVEEAPADAAEQADVVDEAAVVEEAGPPAGAIEVRVLSAHLDHRSDDVIWLSPSEAKAGKAAGWADPDPAAVAYAKSLSATTD
ncbi:hypothetical protein PX699_00410 [Sphingobium sp. H39-3-25]|uniref:hypothetical protein n=1 Tax=Sphingobium arseniciresistens TaxID=3030834 RepID=UPI0023BA04AD|nr:hypothetical protein [Sphingobium arseniciresistens]